MGEGGSGSGMDCQDFDIILEAGLWNDGWNAARDHRLSGTGWSDHEKVVASGHGDLDGAPYRLLPLNLGEIQIIQRGFGDFPVGEGGNQWLEFEAPSRNRTAWSRLSTW